LSVAQEIALTLGGHRSGEGWVCHCPAHQDKVPSLSLRDGETALLVHCFAGCSNSAVLDVLRSRGLLLSRSKTSRRSPSPRPAPGSSHLPAWLDESQERTKAALRMWDETIPLKNTLGQRYFVERRGLHVGLLDLDHCLRWHSGISAVVGLMTHPTTNESTGIHRTFIAEDATKIERKMLGKTGVIRLTADENVLEGLAIAEGIEDALAVLLTGRFC
jgi:putative DNA primase/helicase